MRKQRFVLPDSYNEGSVYFLCEKDASGKILGYRTVHFVRYLSDPAFIYVRDVSRELKVYRDDVFAYLPDDKESQ